MKQHIEANRIEYERFIKDENYTCVKYNPKNGALMAIHKNHNFDPTIGRFGVPRGDYERISIDVLYKYGHKVILESEKMGRDIKIAEGILDGKKFEIKGIEGIGGRNIIDKISNASIKGAETVVLYYPDESVFNENRIINAYKGYLKLSKNKTIKNIYYIFNGEYHKVI